MSELGWVLFGWAFGALLLVAADYGQTSRWRKDEIFGLALWPVVVPVGLAWTRWRRRRTTCRVCGLRWADRETLLRHKCRGAS